jgi:hypothetical protein
MRYLKAWKFYFWFTAIFGFAVLLLDSFLNGLFQLFGVAGLYGYIWSRPVANHVIWQLYLLGLVSLLGFQLIKFADPAARDLVLQNQLLAVAILGLFLVVNAPLFYALARYSSKHHQAWKQNA